MENNGEVREKNERMVLFSGTFPSPFPTCTVPHHPEETILLQGKLAAFAFLISFLLVVVDRTLTRRFFLLIFFPYSCVPYYLCDPGQILSSLPLFSYLQ